MRRSVNDESQGAVTGACASCGACSPLVPPPAIPPPVTPSGARDLAVRGRHRDWAHGFESVIPSGARDLALGSHRMSRLTARSLAPLGMTGSMTATPAGHRQGPVAPIRARGSHNNGTALPSLRARRPPASPRDRRLPGEASRQPQRRRQPSLVLTTGDLDRTEAGEMRRLVLRVQQREVALEQPLHERDERHLRGVCFT